MWAPVQIVVAISAVFGNHYVDAEGLINDKQNVASSDKGSLLTAPDGFVTKPLVNENEDLQEQMSAPQAQASQATEVHDEFTLAKQIQQQADAKMKKVKEMMAHTAAREFQVDQKTKEYDAIMSDLDTGVPCNSPNYDHGRKGKFKYTGWGCNEGLDYKCRNGLTCDTTNPYFCPAGDVWEGSGFCKICRTDGNECDQFDPCCKGYFCDFTAVKQGSVSGTGTCKAWGTGRYPKSACMSMQLCYDEVPESTTGNKTWECACLWGQSPNDPLCSTWHACVEHRQSKETDSLKYILKAVVDLEKGTRKNTALAQNTSQHMAALQEEDDKATDEINCQNPSTMDLMAIECECGADLRKECEGSSNPQECWENVLCSHSGICTTWQKQWCNQATLEQSPVDDAASLDEAMTGKRSC